MKTITTLFATTLLLVAALLSGQGTMFNHFHEAETAIGLLKQDQQEDTIVIPQDDPDRVARRDFMRTKLIFTQNIFGGLVIGDFLAVQQAIDEVEQITQGAQWVNIDNETYHRLTDEFNQSIKRLRKAAESKSIDATALRFYDLSTRCIDCHQHLQFANYEL